MESHEKDLEKTESSQHIMSESESKGGKIRMDKVRITLWVVIAILAILVLYVLFFGGSASSTVTSASQTAGQVARSSSGMVGGC